MSAPALELRPMPAGTRRDRRAMVRAIIASWYARNAGKRPPITLPRAPYLPRVKPWVISSRD